MNVPSILFFFSICYESIGPGVVAKRRAHVQHSKLVLAIFHDVEA